MSFNIDFTLASPDMIVAELGRLVSKNRLARNIKQEDLADEAGISLRTLQRFEKGENTSLDTLVRILMALDLQENLTLLLPEPSIRPMDIIKEKRSEKQRASSPRASEVNENSSWEWGES